MRITKSLKKGAVAGATMLASMLLVVGCSSAAPLPGTGNVPDGDNNNNGSVDNPLPNPGTSGSGAQEACLWAFDQMGKIEVEETDVDDIEAYIRSLNTLTQGYKQIVNGIQNAEVKAVFTDFVSGWSVFADYMVALSKGDFSNITEEMTLGIEKYSTSAEKLFDLCGLNLPDTGIDF